jgi:Myb-like DNA-binding domain
MISACCELLQVRALLTKWSESILEIPTLVQLGYGGVPSPIVDKDEDDISSWGGDSDLGEETERANNSLSRQHSYSRIVNAALRGRDSALTDAEKESIARIASNGSRRTPHSRSNSGDGEQIGIVAAKPHRKGKRHSKRSQPSVRPVEAAGVGDPVDGGGQEQGQPRNGVAPSSPHEPRDPGGDLRLQLARKITANEPIEIDCRSDDDLNALTSSHQGITAQDMVDDETSDADLKPIKLSHEEMTIRPKKRARTHTETAPRPAISSKARPSAPWLDDVACNGGDQEMEDSDDEAVSAVARKPKDPSSRRRFTKEEMDAVRDGVEKYGVGQWKDIQKNDPRLKHRNSTQVKDKYRTMVNRGEID